MTRFGYLVTISLALVFAGFAARAEAQAPSAAYWGQDNCLYSWDGRAYSSTICRVYRSTYVVDYWNRPQRQPLLRVDDNPANMFIDYQFLQGPSSGWLLRSRRAPAGEAVPVGFLAIRNPQGVWANIAQTASLNAAGQFAKDLAALIIGRANNAGTALVLGGIQVVR